MNRGLWRISLLFLFCSFDLMAQESFSQELSSPKTGAVAPIEPLLELPPVLLELEDRLEEKIETLLPTPALPMLSEKSSLLPEAKSPELQPLKWEAQEDVFFLKREKEESHYFDFMGGVGSLASLLADFSWYYFSEKGFSSRFRIAHQNSHFWNYLPPEEQGQNRKEELEWSFTYQKENHQLFLELDYLEQQSWLQNRVEAFDSSVWRRLYLKNSYQYQINSTLFSYGEWALENWIQTENYSENPQSSILLDPRFGIRLQQENYSLDFHLDYHLDYTDSFKQVNHFIGFFTDFQIYLPYRLKLGTTLGLSYDSNEWAIAYPSKRLLGVQFPFVLLFGGKPFDWFSFEISGGYERYKEPLIDQFRDHLAFVDYIDFFNQESWFFQSNFQFFIQRQVEIFSGMEYRKKGNGFILFQPSGDLFLFPIASEEMGANPSGLVALSLYPVETLYLSLGLKAYYLDLVDFVLRYQGEVLSPYSLLAPEHRLSLALDYQIPQKWFGGSFLFQFDVYEEARIPEVSMGFFFEVQKGYRLWLKGEDLLSPIYGKQGRLARWNFMEKGCQVALLVEISL